MEKEIAIVYPVAGLSSRFQGKIKQFAQVGPNNETLIEYSLNQALKEACNYEISLEDHYSTFNGIPTKVKLQKLTKMGILKESDHQKVYNRKQEITIETIEKSAAYRKEKVEMIHELRLRGYYVACFTNSIHQTAIMMLDKTGVLEHLDYLVTNEDVENSKPSPEGYLFLVQKFNVDKKRIQSKKDGIRHGAKRV